MTCGNKVILYPPLNSMDQYDIDANNAIFQYVNKDYSAIQACLKLNVKLSLKARCINEQSATQLLTLYNWTDNKTGSFVSKYANKYGIKLDIQDNHLIVYRSQTNIFLIDEAMRRFTSTVLEKNGKTNLVCINMSYAFP